MSEILRVYEGVHRTMLYVSNRPLQDQYSDSVDFRSSPEMTVHCQRIHSSRQVLGEHGCLGGLRGLTVIGNRRHGGYYWPSSVLNGPIYDGELLLCMLYGMCYMGTMCSECLNHPGLILNREDILKSYDLKVAWVKWMKIGQAFRGNLQQILFRLLS